MNNELINENDIRTEPPEWQHPVLPSPAVQGSILITTNNFTTPPQDSSLFKFIPMEKIIGTANVKMEYDDVRNLFTIYKAKGHLYNNDEWAYEWEPIGSFANLTQEVQEELLALRYVSYRYDTTIPNNLKVYGIKKDGTEELLCNIQFISDTVFNQAIQNLQQQIDEINQQEVQSGLATDITVDSQNKKHINVRYDGNDFSVDVNNRLISNILDDTSETTKGWRAQKIIDYVSKNAMKYKSTVANFSQLPQTANKNDVYTVENESDLYVNISNTTTPSWLPFTKIAESFNNYAIELHKSTNGLYGKLRYDSIDFTIDNFNNLKSQIIDDTLDASSVNANQKTYSIVKILNLLSQAMHYQGQVATYNDLPTTGNVKGDVWNVEDTGDNYAWNGTGWDNFGGEYIAGAGITITGKVISATGISFVVGSGLQATGSGTTTTLLTKNGNGIEYDNGNAIQVKKGSGITVNANGVNVNTGDTTKLVNDNLEVDYSDGLTQDSNNKLIVDTGNGLVIDTNKVKINANFNIKPTPLGTESSKLAIYSDNKIGVDFTESPVILTAQWLQTISFLQGSNQATNINIVDYDKYDMFMFENVSINSGITVTGAQYLTIKNTSTNENKTLVSLTSQSSSGGTPEGIAATNLRIDGLNWVNGTISRISRWIALSWLTGSQQWTPDSTTAQSQICINIYGIKAK